LFDRHRNTRYRFAAESDLSETSNDDHQSVYWLEIMQRAHLGALASLLRAKRWVEGTLAGVAQPNLLATAAALRGLIEAAADTVHGIGGVPQTLASEHARIESALHGTGSVILIAKELEDRLIHFLYARKLDGNELKSVPETHRALRTWQYNTIFEQAGVPNVKVLYSDLCQLTHPAAHSLGFALDVDERGYFLNVNNDGEMLEMLLQEYRPTLNELIPFAFNAGILTLAVLNHFSVQQFHTPEVAAWNLSKLPLWERCVEEIAASALRT
jgi:hypothetical protein